MQHVSLIALFLIVAQLSQTTSAAAPGSHVKFNDEGITLVDSKPFFPIGVFTYNIDPTVLAELHEVQCNTVLHGFNPWNSHRRSVRKSGYAGHCMRQAKA